MTRKEMISWLMGFEHCYDEHDLKRLEGKGDAEVKAEYERWKDYLRSQQ